MEFKYPSDSYRVTIKAIILVQNRLLLVKEDTDLWDLPGGGIEHGESLAEALRRELIEEIGIDVAQVNTELVHAWPTYDPVYKKPVIVLVCDGIIKLEINETTLQRHGAQLYSKDQFKHVVLQRHMEKYRSKIASMAFTSKQ